MIDYVGMIAEAAHGMVSETGWTGPLREVYLGNSAGTVISTTAIYPRSVNYHSLPGQTRDEGTAVLPGNSPILYQENSAYVSNPPIIEIGYPPRSSILTVHGMGSSLAALTAQGNVSQPEQYMFTLGNPHVYNIQDLLVTPTATASAAVSVLAGGYERLSTPGVKRMYGGSTLSLSTPLAALAANQHQIGIVYLDVETEALGVLLVAAATTAGALPNRTALTDLTSLRLMSRQKPCGVIYLYNGQSLIVQADVLSTLDPRFTRPEQPGLTSAVTYNGQLLTYNGRAVYF